MQSLSWALIRIQRAQTKSKFSQNLQILQASGKSLHSTKFLIFLKEPLITSAKSSKKQQKEEFQTHGQETAEFWFCLFDDLIKFVDFWIREN